MIPNPALTERANSAACRLARGSGITDVAGSRRLMQC